MRIANRAVNYVEWVEAATGMQHLRTDDRKTLRRLKDGATVSRVPTEHDADVLAATLHAEMPWRGPATEHIWHAFRKSVREDLPSLWMAVNDLGVTWEMAMNGVPENRGTIERVFGTFAIDFAPRLSGHTFSSIIEKGDVDPEKRAVLKLEDFTFALIRWVTDIYHNAPHRGLGGDTPVKAWRRLSQEYGVLPPPDMEMMRLCFGLSRKYQLDKKGITVLGMPYQPDALQTYLRRKDPHEF